MMLFQPELGLGVLDSLRFFPGEEKINCLGDEVLCVCLRTFH